MSEPSNSNLWGAGSIDVKSDPKRGIVRLNMHFTAAHLTEQETHELVYKLCKAGADTWDPAWALGLYHTLATILKPAL